jgi:putative transposase
MGIGGWMPWKETCAVDQRVALLADWLRDEWTMTELAGRYGITRKTAYKWVGRYEADGAVGLVERFRALVHPGRAISAEARTAILALRGAHPHWGPRKLAAILREREPERPWPAPSTMGELLRRKD